MGKHKILTMSVYPGSQKDMQNEYIMEGQKDTQVSVFIS